MERMRWRNRALNYRKNEQSEKQQQQRASERAELEIAPTKDRSSLGRRRRSRVKRQGTRVRTERGMSGHGGACRGTTQQR